jgi:glycosyltransferase involved in cell wall biosynthesis
VGGLNQHESTPPQGQTSFVVKPPCIVFLFDWLPVFWSTREEYFRQLAERLRERGITPVLVAPALQDPEVRRRFVEAGALIETCSYHESLFDYWMRIRRLRRDFDVRLAHVRFFDYFSLVHWICWLAGVRAILFTEANGGDWNGTGWRRTFIRLRTAITCWPLSGSIAISEFIRARLQRVGIPASRIVRVYNGVDISAFGPDQNARSEVRQRMNASPNTVVLIFAGVLLPIKRPEVAVEVCAELCRRGCQIQLWMAGDGPLGPALETLSAQLGVGEQVKWLGYQKEPQRWMAGADLLLHTTAGEAFGNVFIEAMSCGLPVVGSRSGAAPELVSEAVGRLVNIGPQEVTGLADSVLALTADRGKMGVLSRAAIEHAKRFTIEASVAGTLAVYDSLLASNVRQPASSRR